MRTWLDAIHEQVSTQCTRTFAFRQPSWVVRWTLIAGFLALLAIAVIIVLPVLAVMLVVFLLAAGAAWIHRLLFRLLGGQTEGRRNVRVIIRDE